MIEEDEKKEFVVSVQESVQENIQEDIHLWYSCLTGRKTDSRLLHFISVFSISVGVIIFSAYQLSHSQACETDNLYVGLLTLTLGIWLKSPIF
jgi:hypothetical protein